MLKNNETKLNKIVKELKKISNKMEVKKIGSKYTLFPGNQKYKDYTNIDVSFFNQIKQYYFIKKAYNIIDYVFTIFTSNGIIDM